MRPGRERADRDHRGDPGLGARACDIALARLLPGDAGRPIRWLATCYVDTFRAIPSIIGVIYLVGFGFPLAGVPGPPKDEPDGWRPFSRRRSPILAYVAEVYRSGIAEARLVAGCCRVLALWDSVTGDAPGFVVVREVVRRVTPPLLNDFIGLQKDTALVTIIGTVDAFTQAKIYAKQLLQSLLGHRRGPLVHPDHDSADQIR